MVRRCSPQTAAIATSTSSSPRRRKGPQHSSLTQGLRSLVSISTSWATEARLPRRLFSRMLMFRRRALSVLRERASRMMVYRAAYLKDQGKPFESEAAQAKVFASEHGLRVCDEAIQIHGGYGYADEFDVHRHWRDSGIVAWNREVSRFSTSLQL